MPQIGIQLSHFYPFWGWWRLDRGLIEVIVQLISKSQKYVTEIWQQQKTKSFDSTPSPISRQICGHKKIVKCWVNDESQGFFFQPTPASNFARHWIREL